MTAKEIEVLKEIKQIAIKNDMKAIEVGLSPSYQHWARAIEKILKELEKHQEQDYKTLYPDETERVYYLVDNWSHIQLAREYEEAEKFQKAWEKLKEYLCDNRMRSWTSDDIRLVKMRSIETELGISKGE